MNDAPLGEGPSPAQGAMRMRRKWIVLLLVALGAAAIILGVVFALVTKASIDRASTVFSSGSIPTLPVHTFAQYTQHVAAPDYSSVSVGIVLAAVGAIVLVFGVVAAFKRPLAA